jgi:hypothetical protein
MTLTTGQRLRSSVCTTEIIVVKAPGTPVRLECGGHPMTVLPSDAEATGTPDASHATGTVLGKRYAHEPSALEVLCTKSGDGSLSIDGAALMLQEPKRLPSND